jgi:hypothetical protein
MCVSLYNAVAPVWSNQPLHVCPSQTAATDGIETCHATCHAMNVRKWPRLVNVDSGKHHMKHQLRWLGLTRAVRPVVGGASRSEQPSAAQSGRQSQEARVAWCRTAKTGGSDRLFAPQRVLREDNRHEPAERCCGDGALCRRAVRAPEHEPEGEGVHGHCGGEYTVGEIPDA